MAARKILYTIAAVAVVAVIAVAFVLGQVPPSNSGTQSSSSNSGTTGVINAEGANRTFVATYVSTITSTSSLSTTVSTTTGSTTGQATPSGSFTYAPSAQVQVLSVMATASSGGALSFSVQYQNIGGGGIYVLGGGGSSLSATFVSGGSIVSQVPGPRCQIATTMVPVSPGADHTSVTPGCWSGFHYQLQGAGSVQVQLTLTWSDGADQTGGGSINITASFTMG